MTELEDNRVQIVKKLQKIMKFEKEFADDLRHSNIPDPIEHYGNSYDPYDEAYLELFEAMLIFKKLRRIDDELVYSRRVS